MTPENESDSSEETKSPEFCYAFNYYLPSQSQYIHTEGKGGASMSKKYALDFVCSPGESVIDAQLLSPNLAIILALTDRMRLFFISRTILDMVSSEPSDRLFSNDRLLFSRKFNSKQDAVLLSE